MASLLSNVLPEPRRKLVFVYPDVSISQCCELMIENDIGSLLVTDEYNLIGLVSERDLVRKCLSKGLDPNKTTAGDIAFADVTILSFHDTVEKAMQVMTQTKRRHILIKENEEIVSIISIGDLLFYLLEDKARVIEQLENYINH
ncbi:CBS domain-containing protein [Legionella israelensis]|uniref:CBS domain protein n=1 Tax=Legionella israelensis TaxID=454 RepID=A0A0W0WP05_9GAMM|nr:CBS domain-containing protein [Legionella israelensis]KTD34015.1 CBS domain protein [Legionella israelensis]QBR84545.1 CBS domain-containing protein [Legionella israelensis]QBS10651.1 CBS domain-containing protein [Legionella israelensis]QDP72334.1 CBS domain-containing protein [Legionella israelensis]SCX84551.1 CBS domain-containing protein [Legionella israelensis DSM 19235]